MPLEEKIKKINIPSVINVSSVGPLPSGKADTIEEFFDGFVKPRLPKESVIREWHKLLMKYTDDLTNVSCCVRFGNNGSDKTSVYGERGYYKLRRGWLTQNDCDDFEYFFADNFFSSFIYKMALDEYVPTIDEFREMFCQHKFPYGFGYMIDEKINEYKGVVIPTALEPGFLNHYKLSHVFDSGEHFCIRGGEYGDSMLTEMYFPIGHSNDFLKNINHVRRMHIEDDAKKVIVAKFLRFAHPFNYFLTPAKKHHICEQTVYKNDIGEEPKMINYVRQYLQTTYPDVYSEFLSKIMWYDNSRSTFIVTGKEKIDIVYGLSIIKKITAKSVKTTITKKSTKNTIDLLSINQTYLETFKVGEIANQVLRAILNSGKMPKTDVDKMKFEKGPTSTFELSIPVLSDTIKDSAGRNRYYPEPIVLYGETLYLCSQWLQKHKNNLIKWICNWISSNGGTI